MKKVGNETLVKVASQQQIGLKETEDAIKGWSDFTTKLRSQNRELKEELGKTKENLNQLEKKYTFTEQMR